MLEREIVHRWCRRRFSVRLEVAGISALHSLEESGFEVVRATINGANFEVIRPLGFTVLLHATGVRKPVELLAHQIVDDSMREGEVGVQRILDTERLKQPEHA